MALTITQVPYTGPYSVEGLGKHRGNTPLALKSAMARMGFMPWEPEKWDNRFNEKLEAALDEWDAGKSGYAEGRWTKIRTARIPAGKPNAGEYALNESSRLLIRQEFLAHKRSVPALGPIFHGGSTILMHDLTHATGGISLFPAFDDAFAAGTSIIAPEKMAIYRASSSAPGHAFFCRGASKIRYWFGHLDRDNYVGKEFAKGDFIGRVLRQYSAASHCHVGINIEELVGVGKQLIHHTNYTHGAPLIGAQLEDLLGV